MRALELLRAGANRPDAAFREGQDDAIRRVVEGRGRLLVVQKTGWGKSFVYFIATKLLREAGAGPALLVSPLLALMRNQIAAAERMGVRALRIASDNEDEWETAEAQLRRDEADILLISPERLANERFRTEVLARIAGRISLLVIDEAHCISDWGHDFRPHYRLIERIARSLPPNLRLLATTATANDRVMDDLSVALGPDLAVSRGDLDRPSLRLSTLRLPRQSQRLAWLAARIPELPGHGIIYTLTVRDAERVAEWLQSRRLPVRSYTSESEDREELERALLENRVKALVATTALGMGFDKPDLGFVIHYQTPGSVVAYYQQVGRAGRALEAAYGVLLSGEEETDITDYFIAGAFPTRDEVARVIAALEAEPEGLSVPQLLGALNLSQGRIVRTLALLSLESPAPVAKQGTKWQLAATEPGSGFRERAERLTELRRAEQRRMQEYVALDSGHMQFLVRALDGDPATVRPSALPALSVEFPPSLEQQAIAFLRGAVRSLEPRARWPGGGLPRYGLRGTISVEHRAQPGRGARALGRQRPGPTGSYRQDPGRAVLRRPGRRRRLADRSLATGAAAPVGDLRPFPAPSPPRLRVRRPPRRGFGPAVPPGARSRRNPPGTEDHGEQRPAGAQCGRFADDPARPAAARGPGAARGRPHRFRLDPHRRRLVAAEARQRGSLAAGPGLHRPPPMSFDLSPDTQAILLLTAPLLAGRVPPTDGSPDEAAPKPLAPAEYRDLAGRLHAAGRRPADLLDPGAADIARQCGAVIGSERLEGLLARGFLLSQSVERWRTRAIRVRSRADAGYPQRWAQRLGRGAPPLLYGCGDPAIAEDGGLAVVGSRRVPESVAAYAASAGRLAAAAGRPLISGGARGVDRAALFGALDAGGRAVEVLADSLERAALQRQHREALLDGRLALLSPHDPAAPFHIGLAMQRNKLIYALADAALIVTATTAPGAPGPAPPNNSTD